MVLDCREELKRIRGAESSYERYHNLLHLKAECGLEEIVAHWGDLDNTCRIAILDGLTAADAESISEFLARLIKSSKDRDLVLRHLTHLPRILRLVQPVIDVHGHLQEDLRREVEWFLWSSASGEGWRFLGELASRRNSDPKRKDPVGEVFRRRLFTKQHRGAIAEIAERCSSYYKPVDVYDVAAWLAQFDSDADRILMLRLLRYVEFINSEKIEDASTELWDRLPSADRKAALLTGLGPIYKSGTHLLYEFRPRRNFSKKSAIRDLPTILRSVGEMGAVIVFLDDIIGSGQQAIRFMTNILERRDESVILSDEEARRLRSSRRYYLALAGFKDGVDRVRSSGLFTDVFVHMELTERNRAFSEEAGIFEQIGDLRGAERIAKFYGNALYPMNPEKGEHGPGPLGYDNSQALLVFQYNTPNNTLPILWARGKVRNRDWLPLFPRRE